MLHDGTRVLQTVNHGHLQVHDARDGNRRLTDAVQTADLLEVDSRKGLAGEDFIRRTESRLHDAARGAEDDGGTGGSAQRGVELGLGQAVEVDVADLDQTRQFAGGDGIVDIGIAVHAQFLTLGLILLGDARHDGDADEFLTRNADLVGKVGLRRRTEHTLRGLRRRRIFTELRIELLVEIDPGGAAGGHDRNLDVLMIGILTFLSPERNALNRPMASVPSSMMVRSADQSVSKT